MRSFKKIVSQVFGIDESEVDDNLEYQGIPAWDSINHLELVSTLETQFDVEFDMDDIIDMENIKKIREILIKLGVDEQTLS